MKKELSIVRNYAVERKYEYDPKDVAVALYEAIKARYGVDALGSFKEHFWKRSYPIFFISVKVDRVSQSRGLQGVFTIKKIPASFEVSKSSVAAFDVPPGREREVELLLDAVGAHLATKSIYRGKAISTADGEFLDLSGVSFDDVVYNEKVLRALKAHVWTPIERSDMCDQVKIGLARKVLFEGPYGSGKTMAAHLTAQIALKHGWTFFYIQPTSRNGVAIVQQMLAFARQYQPSVVFLEDVDREQRDGDPYELGAIMAEVDGIASKSAKMIVITTTNHNDKISRGMQRPGRTDKVIHFGIFTAADIRQLLLKTIPLNWFNGEPNWEKVAEECKDYPPAFVREVGKAAMLLAMSECVGEASPRIREELLIEAANDLRPQHKSANESGIGFRSK